MTRVHPLDRGAVVWGLAAVPVLIYDGWLVKGGHQSMSEHATANPIVTSAALLYLAAHFLARKQMVQSKVDPLLLIGAALKGKPRVVL